MKVVLDTNILISAIIFGGKPRIILELIIIKKKIIGLTSKTALSELLGVFETKFKFSQDQLFNIEELVKENFIITNPQKIPEIIKEDYFDNEFLAIADEHPVDFIISGDNHLLKIRMYQNVPIVTPHVFVEKYLNKENEL